MAKNKAAVALGRLGGKKGGKARMAALSAEERSALGKKAARKRWTSGQAALNRLVEAVAAEQKRLQPLLPDIDPADLNLILCSMMRPIEQRRFLLRKRGEMYVR